MIKKSIELSLGIGLLAVFSVNAFASTGVKTSSLSIVKTSSNALPTQCEQMFQEAEKLVTEAEKQPGTHPQMKKLKSQLSLTKQKIQKLDLVMQQKSCDKGLIALNNLKKKR